MIDQGPYDALSPTCPSHLVLSRIGDRWSLFVMLSLAHEPLRFSQLKARIGRVTPKVLTETLRALERDGLVARQAFAESPPRVEYSLTDLGRSLHGPIDAVRRWAEVHAVQIEAAREASDRGAEAVATA